MADQPQSPNASKITAMLQDLAAQKSGMTPPPPAPIPGQSSTQSPPALRAQSTPAAPRLTPPPNLPIEPVRPAPMPPAGVAPAPQPTVPPPAPREPLVTVAPIPKPPMPPPPPIAPSPPVAPRLTPPVPQQKPASAQVSTELRTMSADIGSLRIGQSPQGIRPPSPVAPQPPAVPIVPSALKPAVVAQTAPQPVIVVPGPSGSSIGRKIIYIILGILIIVGILYSLLSLFGGSDVAPTASNTPSPSAIPKATLSAKTLHTYFGNPATTIDIPEAVNAAGDFRNGFLALQPTAKLAQAIAITAKGTALSASVFLEQLMGTVPAPLTAVIGTDWMLLAYGQTEAYEASGTKSVQQTPSAKVIVVIEVTNASDANKALSEWELTDLAAAGAHLLGYDTSNQIVTGFSEGVYRTIPVRYWNFPYADSSIDYALVSASNNKNYLILSASRESMYFAIDQLMQ